MAALPYIHSFYFHNGGSPPTPRTGEAANLKIRYAGDSYAANLPLTIAEVSSTGQYLISGFGDTGVSSYYADCKLYWNGVAQTAFGVFDLGDPSERFMDKTSTSSQSMSGAIAMGGAKITGAGAATANGDLVRFEQALRVDGATQTVTKQTIFDLHPSISGSAGDPPASGSVATKGWVEAQLAGLEIETYPISVNKVIVIPELDVVVGRNYQDLENATLSFASPGTSNRCQVEVIGMGAAVSHLEITSGALRANVGYKGTGRHIRIAPEETSKSGVIRFENCTVIFGNFGGAATARSYTTFEFYNCTVDYFQALTLTTAIIEGCRFRGSSTNAVTLAGVCRVVNTTFNNSITDGGTGVRDYIDNFTDAPDSDPT